MDEHIKREATIDAITDLAGKAPTRSAYEAVWKSARALKKIPAADVAPVVHGRWIHDGRRIESGIDWCHCSECGQSGKFCARTNYCPNCGAKMDGGQCE